MRLSGSKSVENFVCGTFFRRENAGFVNTFNEFFNENGVNTDSNVKNIPLGQKLGRDDYLLISYAYPVGSKV